MSTKPDYNYMNPHPSVYGILRDMSAVMQRRYLKYLWFSHGECDEMMRRVKEMFGESEETF